MFACQILEVGTDLKPVEFLRKLGHEVVLCEGPGEGSCPLLIGDGCTKSERAAGIIFTVDLHNPKHRAILRTYRRLFDVPIRVVVKAGEAAEFAELLEGLDVSEGALGTATLDSFAALAEAVAGMD